MSAKTDIEWTDSTWNPVTGCTEVSPGCDHCYARTFAERWRGTPGHHFERGFDVVLRPGRLDQPLRWKKPRRIFVNSMSDLFHDAVPDEYIAQVFAVMSLARQHTFQVLTKRHGRMRSLLNSMSFQIRVTTIEYQIAEGLAADLNGDQLPVDPYVAREAREARRLPDGSIPNRWPLPNVWVGVSVENQRWANVRIPALLATPAAVRFLSMEPLLGPVDLYGAVDAHGHRPRLTYWLTGKPGWGPPVPTGNSGMTLSDMAVGPKIDWVIVGGESGHGARPMHPDWVRTLRDQCFEQYVPFHFKQWGEWAPSYQLRSPAAIPPGPSVREEHLIHTDQGVIRMHRVGKKAAGREIDRAVWNQYPGDEQP